MKSSTKYVTMHCRTFEKLFSSFYVSAFSKLGCGYVQSHWGVWRQSDSTGWEPPASLQHGLIGYNGHWHCTGSHSQGTRVGSILSHLQAHQQGKNIHVYVDETRPLLQGGRLTTYELEVCLFINIFRLYFS
jgi:hypothetical protein